MTVGPGALAFHISAIRKALGAHRTIIKKLRSSDRLPDLEMMQLPQPDGALRIVARGGKKDEADIIPSATDAQPGQPALPL